jgi:hypothetical protein
MRVKFGFGSVLRELDEIARLIFGAGPGTMQTKGNRSIRQQLEVARINLQLGSFLRAAGDDTDGSDSVRFRP